MKRKLISQGNNSYTLTMPIEWVRANELDKNSEIDLDENEGKIVISPSRSDKVKSTSIMFKENNEKNIRFTLNELYRQGYDEINVEASGKDVINKVESLVEDLFFEMEVTEKDSNSCVIKMLSESKVEHFDIMLNKMFSIIKDSLDLIEESLRNKDFSDLSDLNPMTKKYRKYDNFCRRFIFTHPKGKESLEYIALFVKLLIIQTDLNRLGQLIESSKNKNLDGSMFFLINENYSSIKQAFVGKNVSDLYNINDTLNKLLDKGNKSFLNKDMSFLDHHSLVLVRMLYSLVVPMIGLALAKKDVL